MTKTREVPTSVFISDWDQTVTSQMGGTNGADTHFGLDYITAEPEKIVQQYIVPGFADVVSDMLANEYLVMIATSQPFPQVIRRALFCLLGEKANDIIIVCGEPKNLVYKFKRNDNAIDHVPLHTKDIASRELMMPHEVSDQWAQCYKKRNWNTDDVTHMIALMDSLGLKNIGVLESKKERYIWDTLKNIFPNPGNCQKIIYVDDSKSRLRAFQHTKPAEFLATSLTCITATPDGNCHFISVLEAAGKLRTPLPLPYVEMLSPSEVSMLVDRLKLTPVRLKKFSRGNANHFFIFPSVVKTLPNTIVKLVNDHFMLIDDVPATVAVGKHAKVKAQTTIKLSENGQLFTAVRDGLVKIHHQKEKIPLQLFVNQVTQEADLFRRYNHLTNEEVQLQVSKLKNGVRVYMTMPMLGISLTNESLLSKLNLVDRLTIFYAVLEKLKLIHQDGNGHFDLAPQNILYDEATRKVHLCDFGLAHALGGRPLMINKLISPPVSEDMDDQVSFGYAYDIFSLGVSMALLLGFSRSSSTQSLSFMSMQASASVYEDAQFPSESSYSPPYVTTEHFVRMSLFDFSNNPLDVSQDVIKLLEQMLSVNSLARPSVVQCLTQLEEMGIEPSVMTTPKF